MENLLTIHFFRDNSIEAKLDFNSVLEFFENQPNFQIYYSDGLVEIEYKDVEFDFKYHYLITKKSRVNQIYRLSPKFSNVNFLVEFPILIPSPLAREILGIIQKLCKTFELGIYHDSFSDIRLFNLVEMIDFYESAKKAYLANEEVDGKISYDAEKLNVICKFQRSVKNLIEYYHNDVIVNYCYGLIQTDASEGNKPFSGICYDWRFTSPIIFPPYVDFINVMCDDMNFIIRRADLFNIINRKLIEIKNFLPDMYILKVKQAKACKMYLKKLVKAKLNYEFRQVKLIDCLEAE